MTKKLNPLEDPPTASSSDDDDIGTSDAGDASDDSSSSQEDSIKIPSSAAAPPKSSAAVDSDSGSETETDSDSESTNPPNSGSGKTIAVPTTTTVNPKKKEDPKSSSAAAAALALPAAKSGTKRPASEAAATTSTKRVKKEEESVKKPAFQRLWTEEDEISVLQGMVDYKADTGKSPYEDTNAYYELIKESISFEVSKNQLMDKIRSLKKKYLGKERKNGVEPSFVKAHDQKAYDLSKVIWGPEGIAQDTVVKSNGVSKKSVSKSSKKKSLDSVKQELVFGGGSPNGKRVEDGGGGGDKEGDSREYDWFEDSSLVKSIAGFGVDEGYVKQRWSLVPVETKKVIEEKMKLLHAKELEFVLEKTGLLHQVASMIVEASKN